MTRPSFSSSVSARPIPANNSVAVAASSAFDKFFMAIPFSVPTESAESYSTRSARKSYGILSQLDERMSRTGCAKCELLGRLIQIMADVFHQSSALFLLSQASYENDQHIGSFGEDDRRVMVDFGDLAGLVGNRD